MRRWLRHIWELNTADAQIFIKNTTLATLMASIPALAIKMLTMMAGYDHDTDTEAFLKKNANRFNCTYQLNPFKLSYLNDLDTIETFFYIGLPATVILISWIITAIEIKNRHQFGWMKYETQEIKGNISNLEELEVKARNYKKYDSLYEQKKESKQLHPIYLCDEKGELLHLPAIVSNKGTLHSFEEFKQGAEIKLHSPHGIIDLQLTEQIICYLEDKPLSFDTYQLYKIYPSWQRALFSCLIFSKEASHGIVYGLKRIIPAFLFLLLFINCIFFGVKKHSNPEITVLDSILIYFGFKFAFSSAVALAFTGGQLLHTLADWFDRKNTLLDTQTPVFESEINISFLFLCSITHLPLERAILCDDGRVYSEDALNTALKTKMESPMTKQTFQSYPLIWPYNQRQNQVNKFLQKVHDEKVLKNLSKIR